MEIMLNGSRVTLELTTAQALELIENLSKSVDHCQTIGGAWFSGSASVQDGMNAPSAGRLTVRIEG